MEKFNDYGQGSEIDDLPIYQRAWYYSQANQEFQNLNNYTDERKTITRRSAEDDVSAGSGR